MRTKGLSCLLLAICLFVCLSSQAGASGRSFYKIPSAVRRSHGPLMNLDNFQANELMADIISDVDAILNEWDINGGPRNDKAMWLKDVLGDSSHETIHHNKKR